MSDDKLKQGAEKANAQKQRLMNEGGYAMIPHSTWRDTLHALKRKYKGNDIRDALALYCYLHAYVNGESERNAYMWAYPDVGQIANDLAISRNRIKPLVDILEDAGLLETHMIKSRDGRKKFYLPLYFPADEHNH